MFKSIIIKYVKDFLDYLSASEFKKAKALFILLNKGKILLYDFLL